MTIIWHNRHNFLSSWTIFCPSPSPPIPMDPENQYFKKMKKTPEDIIILYMSTLYDNHMMYGFWDIKRDRHIFLPFWTIFLPFYNNPKNQNFEKWEKPPGDIINLMVPKIWAWQTEFYHFCPFTPPPPPLP